MTEPAHDRRRRTGVTAFLSRGVVTAAVLALVAACGGSSGGTTVSTGGGPSATPSSSTPGSVSPSASSTCTPAGGSRCPGPEPVPGPLTVDGSGRQLSGFFSCGGRLTAQETSSTVTVTYIASAVRHGGMACARIRLTVTLQQPLGTRTVVDGTTGQPVTVTG